MCKHWSIERLCEGRTIEFKRCLPGNGRDEIKEFLNDVTALANANGGDIIFGIEDRSGIASAVVPIEATKREDELLRLENIARDSIEPRIFGLHMRWIKMDSETGVIIIRTPSSILAPHRANGAAGGRYFNRNSQGSYEMDSHELRQAFIASIGLPTQISRLHNGAIEIAHGKDFPIAISKVACAHLSIIPIGVLKERPNLQLDRDNVLPPYKPEGISTLISIEGITAYSTTNDGHVLSLAITNRDGWIHSSWKVGPRDAHKYLVSGTMIYPQKLEEGLVTLTHASIAKLKSFGIDGPFAVCVSLTNLEGKVIPVGEHETSEQGIRATIAVPPFFEQAALAPAVEAFWWNFVLNRPADLKPLTDIIP